MKRSTLASYEAPALEVEELAMEGGFALTATSVSNPADITWDSLLS